MGRRSHELPRPRGTHYTYSDILFRNVRVVSWQISIHVQGNVTFTYILEHGILPRSVSPTYITSANLHVLRLACALPLPLPRQRQINFAHRRLRRDLDNVGNHICGGIGGIGGD